jgi:hypothetical protein
VAPRKINRISLAILAAGFAAALVIWLVAPPPATDDFQNDPLNEKRYRRQLAVIGGQANQLQADFVDWFESLWVGPQLGGTVAVLTVVAVGGFRFVAVRMKPPGDQPGRSD